MGMGGGLGGIPPTIDNPFSHQEDQGPRHQRPIYHTEGKWDIDSVDQELSFIKETKRVIDNPDSDIGIDKQGSFKTSLKEGLERLGWKLNRGATFRANFPFGSTYLIFDSTSELDVDECYKMKMVMGNSKVLDYRIMKWVVTEISTQRSGVNLIKLITNGKFLIILSIVVLALLIYAFVRSFVGGGGW